MLKSPILRQWQRLVRFHPKSDPSKAVIGQPIDPKLDVGLALRHNTQDIPVQLYSGTSVLAPGKPTGQTASIARLLSPVSQAEAGTIRCIGLNYRQHAAEVNLPLPTTPSLFLKPATALTNPYPTRVPLPHLTQADDSGDYEAELAVVIGAVAKNVRAADALSYVLGYTAANDVSSRTAQFATSQWCFSKGFDGSCPLGPVLVSPNLIPDPGSLKVKGLRNGELLQDGATDDLIFGVAELIAFLSQGTTLLPGTVILTGTPAGVGVVRKPKVTLRAGDEFHVQIEPHVGTLVSVFENEP
ncbi:uncharacterized protein HMPREF1541_10000 [Cyphellophora europaea CBS 101466]|uniref:Fumarylacetoacetase-like C-terminal domain-containing protein n=1 Tax=Cyphellophora europaea (strain CBS 101466) TaxID=1220924 RepID=W2SAS2_CYPE1|nr:uncharacterized protein HMPREF1541_10000 [Cyphellophora europaea CBS 101466]ETN45123.1 hypothetical protein HMPREF1541_10000 [Cyphellophora europaea CBS 101466]